MFENDTLDEINKNGVREYFERYGTKIEVKKETSICSPKLSDSYVYYLVSGIASLTSLTKSGEEKVFLYFPQDRLLGFAPALMRHYRGEKEGQNGHKEEQIGEAIPFGIDTKTNCLFYRMPERVFYELMEQDHRFLYYVMEVVTYNYVEVIHSFHDAQEENAKKRFCKWLLMFSTNSRDGRVVSNVFTFVEIAKYLNMHPVTISKLAANLRHLGVIRKDRSGITILDENALRNLI